MITSYLTDTATRIRETLDKFNRKGTPDRLRLACLVRWEQRVVRVPNGQDKLAAATVYFETTADILATDTIEIEGTPHAVLRIARRAAFGPSHLEVTIA